MLKFKEIFKKYILYYKNITYLYTVPFNYQDFLFIFLKVFIKKYIELKIKILFNYFKVKNIIYQNLKKLKIKLIFLKNSQYINITIKVHRKMNKKQITSLLNENLKLTKSIITGDNNHIKIIAIGDIFKGISQVKRQQMVYTPLTELILEKHVHAISITSYTIDEWEKNKITHQ